MNGNSSGGDRRGFANAVGAYLIWGFLPVYLLLVKSVPPAEFIGWRIIFTLPICLAIVAARRQVAGVLAALRQPKVLGWLSLSAVLVGFNWLVYVWAIQTNHVFAASLGYYINPLVNVLLGTVFLGERLTRLQWIAVGLAATGVAVLMGGAVTMLGVSLSLAASFGLYGLVRKQVPVGSLPGLTIESALLIVPALGIVWYYAASPAGSAFGNDIGLSLAIMLGGVLTAIPLLMFAVAARLLPYSTLGFIQFLAPSIVFLLGLFLFKEPLRPVQLISFIFIWSAAGLFIYDLLARRRKAAAEERRLSAV